MKIILASGSPRRKEILETAGIPFEVCVSDVEENCSLSVPSELVMALSKQKAEDVAAGYKEDVLVIGADTVVAFENEILGKPKDRADAVRMIRMLSGATHQVYTGVTLHISGQSHTFYAVTDVEVAVLDEAEILSYVNSGEPDDKAGAYAIQGLFGKYITAIRGEYYNVVGLPIAAIHAKCKELGIKLC